MRKIIHDSYKSAVIIEERKNEVTLIKKNDWDELFFDSAEDIRVFINDLIAAKFRVFGK